MVSGTTHTLIVTGLDAGKTYYFALRTRDELETCRTFSNGATTFAQFDLVAPSGITNLSALAGDNHGEAKLTWTNPGDDGTASALTGFYRIDYSTTAGTSWTQAVYKMQVTTTNAAPFSSQSQVVTGLTTSVTYYFRVWAGDEQTTEKSPTWSALSNGATLQNVAVTTVSLSVSRTPNNPRPGDAVTYVLTFSNTGSAGAQNFVVRNRIPENSAYVNESIQVDGVTKTDTADSDAGLYDTGLITVNYGTLAAGASNKTVRFQVAPSTGRPAGSTLLNGGDAPTSQSADQPATRL